MSQEKKQYVSTEVSVEMNEPLSPKHGEEPINTSSISYAYLRKMNRIAATLHFVQFVFMLAASFAVKSFRDFKLDITYVHWEMVEKKGLVSTNSSIGLLAIGPFVSLFFLLSAVFQGITTVGKYNTIYNLDLSKGINRFRWYEYSISSSIMIVIIALLVGISDIGYLLQIFTCNMVMNFFGLLMEVENSGEEKVKTWRPFWFGSVCGATPWIAVFISLFSGSSPPDFVYAIFFTYFVLFQTFPLNMTLQYKKVGKWVDYHYGELVYIVLSLVAKTLLGWLVFGGLNQPNESSGNGI